MPASRSTRTFVDSVGVSWTVREVTPLGLSPTFDRLREGAERRRPWLVFESDEGEKRRLVPVPANWRELSDFVIERWCMRATVVPPAPSRRGEDRDERRGAPPG